MRIVGRETETNWIAGPLDAGKMVSRVVTLEAPAGAGKSSVLAVAAEAATQAGVRLLRCQPIEVESVTRTRRSADPVGERFDARAVGIGCAAVWRRLADEGPLMIVIDDVQWLDAASADALTFSVRRLPAGVLPMPGSLLTLPTPSRRDDVAAVDATVKVTSRPDGSRVVIYVFGSDTLFDSGIAHARRRLQQ